MVAEIYMNMKTSLPAGRQGFTLMELLVVVAIIGILIAIAAASYGTLQKAARDSRRVSDIKAIQTAWEQYFSDPANSQNYPGPIGSYVTCTIDLMNSSATFLPAGFPTDPKTGASYTGVDGGSLCSNATYCFCAGMETSEGGNSDKDCNGNSNSAYKSYYCVRNLQ